MLSSANLPSIRRKCSLYAASQQSSDRIATTLRLNALHILFHDPASLPANVKLQDGNVLEPFSKEYLGTYDLVHVKLLYAALTKDESLLAVKNLKTLLKPYGYLFWSEIEAYGYASNPYSAALHEWKSIESAEAVKFGRDPM
ncbi:hypothetical protein FOC1_g10013441 [Fusarium oxysporum f. sp. cubense race 1]|uniref:Methyltransferase type 11 domain-containing protein n=1 Tax=Fusarium oxysporum f. sp. cubense (strain race 1) TaxID=1229664 RepID=N4URM5_FUSC1|nr:hypothetical protein FOC1_g10013441 [Fusarium oxysporum f. sp. cubense race 1]